MSTFAQPTIPLRPKDGNIRLIPSGDTRSSFFKRRSHLNDDVRRDSGMAPSLSTTGNGSNPDMATTEPNNQSNLSSRHTTGEVPAIILNDDAEAALPGRKEEESKSYITLSRKSSALASTPEKEGPESTPPPPLHFRGISTEIPTGELDDVFKSDSLSFSKRGSIRGQGRNANGTPGIARHGPGKGSTSSTNGTLKRSPSMVERRMSQKLRSLYEYGEESVDTVDEDGAASDSPTGDTVAALPSITSPRLGYELGSLPNGSRPPSVMSNKRASYIKMEPWEAAGGIEDWRNVDSRDVDKYGFIKPRNVSSRVSSMTNSPMPGSPKPGTPEQLRASPRSGALATVDEGAAQPRKLRRLPPDSTKAHRLSMLSSTAHSRASSRPPSRATQAPSVRSTRSRLSFAPSFRSLSGSSRPPRNRKFARDAPLMLTSSPGLPESAVLPPAEPTRAEQKALYDRDRSREVKWDAMARRTQQTPSSGFGAGDSYEFDTTSTKLINRTWKGIPDKWRGPAWHSFLTTSARRRSSKSHPFISDAELIARFQTHQTTDYPDDMQIDMDVPRTIGNHLSFHVRYRGGQRLLFRVLHALALEYPTVGYVQGMAPLVATLLLYYDDERAFVVACRLWEFRGLAKLFSPGFGGLMGQLDVFKEQWLKRGNERVSAWLEGLGVEPLSFAVKWYLTLFAYSLPFEAQLRVWDVFMLLGGGEGGVDGSGGAAGASRTKEMGKESDEHDFDVLHAIGSALIDALAPSILEAEFEGAMALLTAHVPVGRADLLMEVARGEWRGPGVRR